MSIRTRSIRAATAATMVGAALFVGAGPAEASYGQVGQRETVCAVDLEVRKDGPGGARIGTLHRGETFYIRKTEGSWAEGIAYGHINHDGWVQNGWFYPLPCSGP